MTDYCKGLIIDNCIREIKQVFIKMVEANKYITMENFLQNLEGGSYFYKEDIEKILKLYFD